MNLQSVFEKIRNKDIKLLLSATITPLFTPTLSFAKLEKFVDPLPIPHVARPTTYGGSHYQITMEETAQKLHRNLLRLMFY